MSLPKSLFLALFTLLTLACSPVLTHTALAPVARKTTGDIAVLTKADNMGSLAGFGSISPFAIPVCPVFLQGDPEQDLMIQLKAGLEHAGYTVKMVKNATEAGGQPVLSCRVNIVKFWNYTWLFPLV